MWISRYCCLFFIYSLLGWVYECIFCTIQNKKWENRGFLIGPICPIYGVGAVLVTWLSELFMPIGTPFYWMGALKIFLISFFGGIILEYSTSWTLEKLFHAVWWDYNNFPLNLNGRVSLFTSLGFGIAGPIVIFFVIPPIENLISLVPPLLVEFLSLVLVMICGADIALTVSALSDFERNIEQMEDSFNDRMDALVETVQSTMGRARQAAIHRVKSFRYPKIRSESLAQIRVAIRVPKPHFRGHLIFKPAGEEKKETTGEDEIVRTGN